jgi:uncharacterized metal-binding protein
MEPSCGCAKPVALFLACSGAADLGAISDQVARALAREGAGKMFCLAGVGAGVSGMVKTAEAARPLVMIDGCGVECGRQCLERAGITEFVHVQLEGLGYEKGKTGSGPEVIAEVASLVRARLAALDEACRASHPEGESL